MTVGGGGRSAVQLVQGTDVVTAGGGGGGADCLKTRGCGGGGKKIYTTAISQFLFVISGYAHLGGGGIIGETPRDSASGRGGSGTTFLP